MQDILETATTEIADVVLPAQALSEREGTFTSGERRVQRFYAAVPVKGDSRPDFAITSRLPSTWALSWKVHPFRWCSTFLRIQSRRLQI